MTGIDISEGMIRQARNLYPGIDFRQIAAEELDYNNEFDISRVTASRDIKPVFSHRISPWFFLPAKENYLFFFEKQGFKKEYIEIKQEIIDYSIDNTFAINLY